MFRVLAIALISLVVASPSRAQNDNRSEPADRELAAKAFYPLAQGAKWHYVMNADGEKREMTNQVAKLEKIDGQQLYRIETLIDGQMVTEHLSQTDKGLFRHRFNGAELSPPLLLLRNPIKKGDRWQTKTQVGGKELVIDCTVGADSIEVPAGKFKTVKLSVTTKVEDTEIVSDYWFAEDVGIVKQVMDIGGEKVSIELKKYEPPKQAAADAEEREED